MNDRERFKETFDHIVEYVKDRIELLRIQVLGKLAEESSELISSAIITIILAFFLLFSSLTTAIWLGKVFGAYYIGFGIVSGFYLLLFLVLAIFKRPLLDRPMMNKAIRRLFKKEDEDDE